MRRKIFYVTFPLILLPSLFPWFHLDDPAVTITGVECLLQRWITPVLALVAYYVGEIESRRDRGYEKPFIRMGYNVAHIFLLLSLLRAYQYWPVWCGLSRNATMAYSLQAAQPAFWVQGILIVIHWILFWRYGRELVYLEPQE